MSLKYIHQTLENFFPRTLTPSHSRQSSPFGKRWTDVLKLLERELKAQRYRPDSVVIMTAHYPRDLRNDGQLRSDARNPEHPGVVLKFDKGETIVGRLHYAPMSFECDNFTDWKANVRAIADALEALRKVDRFKVSGSGKTDAHYSGYKLLTDGSNNGAVEYTKQAEIIARYSSEFISADRILLDRNAFERAYQEARMKTHPDMAGGSNDKFIEVERARKALSYYFSNVKA